MESTSTSTTSRSFLARLTGRRVAPILALGVGIFLTVACGATSEGTGTPSGTDNPSPSPSDTTATPSPTTTSTTTNTTTTTDDGGTLGVPKACDAYNVDVNNDPKDGCEVDLRVDPNNCGKVGVSCAGKAHMTGTCVAGSCACEVPFVNADGSNTNGCEENNLNQLAVPNGQVNALIRHGNRLFVGGGFQWIGPNVGHFAALNAADGTAVSSACKVNGIVRTTARDANNGFYVGGQFTSVSCGDKTYERMRLAHFNADGSLDPNWAPAVDPYGGGWVSGLALDNDVVYVAGTYGQIGSEQYRNLAAVDATTGAVKTAWAPQPNGMVVSVVVNGDYVYAGGGYSNIGNTNRQNLGRLDRATGNTPGTGALDPNWVSGGANSWVRAFAVAGNLLYIGGDFSNIGGQAMNRLVRVDMAANTTGPDSWSPNITNNSVFTLAHDATNNKIYVGGNFGTVNGNVTRNRLALFPADSGSTDATVDATWDPNPNSDVTALMLSNDKLYVGGRFNTFVGSPNVSRWGIAELPTTGTGVPNAWDPGLYHNSAGTQVFTLDFDKSGNVLAGGDLLSVKASAVNRNNLFALDLTTGSVDPNWDPNIGGGVQAMALYGDDLYVGGTFGSVGGVNKQHVARIYAVDGTPYQTWSADATGGSVYALKIKDKTMYIAGDFNTFLGTARNRVARLDLETLTLDNWDPNVSNGQIFDLIVSDDGKSVVFGGSFNDTVGGTAADRIAKVNTTDGALDSAWSQAASANGVVRALMQRGDKVFVGGDFTNIGGANRARIASLDSTGKATSWDPGVRNQGNSVRAIATGANNSILIGGSFDTIVNGNTTRWGFAAFAEDGSLLPFNPGFDANPGQARWVMTIATSGTSIYAGGNFTTVGGASTFGSFTRPGVTGIDQTW